MASFLPSALLLACAAAPARAASSATLMGVDVYGTDRFTAADVEARFGAKLRAWVDRRNSADRSKVAVGFAEELRARIEGEVLKAWDLGWARLSWLDYFTSESRAAFITVDVVERADMKTRLPYRAPPAKELVDESGLLALWQRYYDAGWALVRAGQLKTDRPACPAFYCQWGSQTPELKAMEEKIVAGIPAQRDFLLKAASEDRDPAHRASAIYLLSYLRNGAEISHLLLPALTDHDVEVRAAAMRVFSDLAIYHPEVYLPIERIAAMLDYPMVEDRNKALAVVMGLADRPEYRDYVLRHATDYLLKLLALKQPANHDLAYAVLGILSRQSYPASDLAAWRDWAQRARAAVGDKSGAEP